MADLLGAQARRWKFQHLHRLERVRRVWPQAAGDYVARHVSPVKLYKGTLRLAVVDASWANELSYLAPEILERLRQLLPKGWVEELKVVQGEVLPPDAAGRDAQVPQLPEASPAMQARAQELSEDIADENLAEAVRRARLASLRRLDAEGKKKLNTQQLK